MTSVTRPFGVTSGNAVVLAKPLNPNNICLLTVPCQLVGIRTRILTAPWHPVGLAVFAAVVTQESITRLNFGLVTAMWPYASTAARARLPKGTAGDS
jgi:hypothetical protein